MVAARRSGSDSRGPGDPDHRAAARERPFAPGRIESARAAPAAAVSPPPSRARPRACRPSPPPPVVHSPERRDPIGVEAGVAALESLDGPGAAVVPMARLRVPLPRALFARPDFRRLWNATESLDGARDRRHHAGLRPVRDRRRLQAPASPPSGGDARGRDDLRPQRRRRRLPLSGDRGEPVVCLDRLRGRAGRAPGRAPGDRLRAARFAGRASPGDPFLRHRRGDDRPTRAAGQLDTHHMALRRMALGSALRSGRSVAALAAAGCGASPLDAVTVNPHSLTMGLVAHWTFDEGSGSVVADSSGKRPRRQL